MSVKFNISKSLAVLTVLFASGLSMAQSDTVRVKDLGKLKGWRENALIGTGIVTGLAGTGDSPSNRTARQSLSNILSQFNLTVPQDAIQSRNVAVVTVSAALPTFAREGDTLDVTVSSMGDARSLVGGTLMMAPLKAANGRVYALAQGSLSVGGYRYDANGNVVQKNHPTTGSVPNGATVEVGVTTDMLQGGQRVTFVLSEPDYTTANRVAQAINSQMGRRLAHARDASGIDIEIAAESEQLVSFLSAIENVKVEPDRRAKVVVNERTGTVVSGGDVRISEVTISYGDIKIAISTQNAVSQPFNVWQPGEGVRTQLLANSQIDVADQGGANVVSGRSTVSDLVRSLASMKASTRDVISILRAVKAAGALHGELIVQ